MGWYIKAIAARTGVGLETRLLPPVQRILPIVIYSVAFMVALESLNISISPSLSIVHRTCSDPGVIVKFDLVLRGGPSEYIQWIKSLADKRYS